MRGAAEPIRYMLRHSDIEWEDVRLPFDKQGFKKWMDLRSQPGMVCANLPFIEDGDNKISHTVAVLRYVARKTGLMPQDQDDVKLCEMVEQELVSLRNELTLTCHDYYKVLIPGEQGITTGQHDFEHLKKLFTRLLKDRLSELDLLFETGALTGGFDRLTYVDFMAFEFLDQFRIFAPETFSGFQNIQNFLTKFAELEAIKEWREGEVFKAGEYINSPLAEWHGK